LTAGLLFLARNFLARSPSHPWVSSPRFLLLLWIPLIAIAAFQALRGLYLPESMFYLADVFVAGMVMSLIGVQIAQSADHLRTLLAAVSAFGALVALHTIIYARSGIFLLATSDLGAYLDSRGDFPLQWASTSVTRVGSFLFNPDWNGAFLAMMAFAAMGLFVDAESIRAKALYFGEMALILVAVLYTYSAASVTAIGLAMVVFLALLEGRQRIRFLLTMTIGAAGGLLLLSHPLSLLLEHGSAHDALQLRQAAWETAIRVIRAYPWVGTGLGSHTYAQVATRYNVPLLVDMNNRTFDPLNSYLEIAAEAGLPALVLYASIIGVALWLALRNWRQVDSRSRALIAGAIAAIIALSANGLAIPTWTLPPLAAVGWLILGAVASPALARHDPLAPESDPGNAPCKQRGADRRPQRMDGGATW
jgi:O-antigen ligase